ncbi:MAG TPA: hypothetical protein PL169_20045 [Leptospiraceae bacterium]|nr:hypothetical protein [Leptospiraceae bacterium]
MLMTRKTPDKYQQTDTKKSIQLYQILKVIQNASAGLYMLLRHLTGLMQKL